MEIRDKRILISGGSRGLGRALVFAFAAAGAKDVYAGVRKPADSESVTKEAIQMGVSVIPIKLDVTVHEDVQQATRIAPIDILVNNAGVAGFGNPLTMKFETIQEEVDVNYLGAVRMVRAFAPSMIAQGQGMIVNVATAFSKINLPVVGTYCATKAALLSLGQCLRAYLAESQIRVITVMPTTIDTDMSRGANVPKMTKEFVAAQILSAIRDESYDPPIGDQAREILAGLARDYSAMERMFAQVIG